MSNTAPVCLIDQPAPAGSPSVASIPAIPAASASINSLLAAVRALTQAVQIMQQQIPKTQLGGVNFNDPGNGNSSKPSAGAKQANFAELIARRTYTTTRVFNPDDHTQFVDVKQITGLTFYNPVSNQYINWVQGGGGSAG